jgi:hypothetical protein
MISPAQRLLSGMAPPLLAVHVVLSGMAPFTLDAPAPPSPEYPGVRQVRFPRPVAFGQQDEVLLLIAWQIAAGHVH